MRRANEHEKAFDGRQRAGQLRSYEHRVPSFLRIRPENEHVGRRGHRDDGTPDVRRLERRELCGGNGRCDGPGLRQVIGAVIWVMAWVDNVKQ